MSGSVNNFPSRDSTGRFIRRPDVSSQQPSDDHPELPRAVPQPSHPSARPSRQPPDISDSSSIPFSALISRTTSRLNAPDSDSPDPLTPSPDSPEPPGPATPVRRSTSSRVDNEPPLPPPEFTAQPSHSSQDSDSIPFAPTRDLLIPKLDIYASGSTEGLAYRREVLQPQPQPPRTPPPLLSTPHSTPAYTARLGHHSLPYTCSASNPYVI
ncbi:hypothetical protein V8E52_009537, partial [Russula decolorans]